MNPTYHDAESFLAAISDDVPLFTNTREGVYSQDAREAAPAPLESGSETCVDALSDMRALLLERRKNSERNLLNGASPTTPTGEFGRSSSVKAAANMIEANSRKMKENAGTNGMPQTPTSPFGRKGSHNSSLADEQTSQGGIMGLQDGIDGLQDDELDTSEVAAFKAPQQPHSAPVRGARGVTWPPPPANKENAGDERRDMFNKGDNPPPLGKNGEKQPPKRVTIADKQPPQMICSHNGGFNNNEAPILSADNKDDGKALEDLDLQPTDRRDVSPTVIQGLVKIMSQGTSDKRRKATIAMCNLCCESKQNRANAHQGGVVECLVAMMKEDNDDEHLRRLATACICNLSADPPLKDSIAASGAIRYLSKLLDPEEDSVDARAATAHAAATLWSLCVDMEHIKPLVAQEDTLKALLKQLNSPESFVRGQACGCVGEVCIGNKEIKGHLSRLGAIPSLISLLDEPEHATQRLAASALCNLLANHDPNKKLSRECGLLEAFAKLLKATSDDAVQSAAAGGLYNLVSVADRKTLENLGVIELLRKVPISKHINVRLGIKEKK